MKLERLLTLLFISASLLVALPGCGGGGAGNANSDRFDTAIEFFGYPVVGSDATRGARIFGIEPGTLERLRNCNPGGACEALFEGTTDDGLLQITSNGRNCFDCHQPQANFQLGALLPLLAHFPADDPLLKFVHADSQDNPDGPKNLQENGLILIRPHRLKNIPLSDPYKKVISWRKVPTMFNLAFAHGFLADLRESKIFNTDQSATMTHTQEGDVPFRNVSNDGRLDDLEAFLLTLFTDSRLEGLLYPGDTRFNPTFDQLVADPYLTVDLETDLRFRR